MDLFNFLRPDVGKLLASHNIRGLIRALEYPDTAIQRSSAAALEELAPGEAVGPLIQALRSPDRDVRRLSASALGRIREPAAVDGLVEALDDPDPGIRLEAIEALGKIGDRGAVGPVVAHLDDGNMDVRMMAFWSLGRLGDTVAAAKILLALVDPDYGIRLRAAEALEKLGMIPEDNQDRALYFIAKNEWGELPRIRNSAVGPLVWALKDSYFNVRQNAARALGRIKDVRAVIPLITALKDEDGNVRMEAAAALGEIEDKRAVPALTRLLGDEYVGTRMAAAQSLDAMHWKPTTLDEQIHYLIVKERWLDLAAIGKSAGPQLLERLDDPYYSIREQAAKILRTLGRDAFAPMMKAFKSDDADVRRRAIWILGKTGDSQAIDPLVSALHDPSPECREEAVRALGELEDPHGIPSLARIIEEDESMAPAAVWALGKIHSPEAVGILVRCLGSPDRLVRLNAIHALLQEGNATLLARFSQSLGDPDPEIRGIAVRAIAKYGQEGSFDLLLPALRDSEVKVRRLAVRALIRSRNRAVVALLTGLLDDPDEEIRKDAAVGLDHFGWKPTSVEDHRRYLVAMGQWKDLERLGFLVPPKNPEEGTGKHHKIQLPGSLIIATADAENTPEGGKEGTSPPGKTSGGATGKNPEGGVFGLIRALDDKKQLPATRWQAAEGLGELGDVRGVDPLISTLKDRDAELRWRAALALGMLGQETGIAPLCEALRDDEQRIVRMRAAEALGRFRSGEATKALSRAVGDTHPDVRASAILALGQIRSEPAISVILTGLLDSDDVVRETAINALLQLGVTAGKSLVKGLRDRNPEVKKGALTVLSRMQPDISSRILVQELESPDAGIREMVAATLEGMDWRPENEYQQAVWFFARKQWSDLEKLGKTAEGILIRGTADNDPNIRRASAELLGTLGDRRSVSALTEVLRDDDREVRLSSLRTLLSKKTGDGAQMVSALKKEGEK